LHRRAPVVDLSHGVPPLDIRAGALVLADSFPYIRHDAVVLAVVDPSVGRDRDIAVKTGDGRLLVGPDNGLLAPFWHAAEGPARAVSITSSNIVLSPVSASLHARDVLAPAAAHLAIGLPLDELGERLEPETLVQLEIPNPAVEQGRIECEVLDLNRFGNVQLKCPGPARGGGRSRPARARLRRGPFWVGHCAVRLYLFGPRARGMGLMVDPRGWLSVVRGNPANAAEGLGVSSSDLIWLTAPRN